MKQILFLLLILMAPAAFAQKGGWVLQQNSKTIFSALVENETKNILQLQRHHFAPKQQYRLVYRVTTARGWKRYFICTTAGGEELKGGEGSTLTFTSADLKTWTQQHKALQFYTWALPADPAKAATVRVRRVHLLTLSVE